MTKIMAKVTNLDGKIGHSIVTRRRCFYEVVWTPEPRPISHDMEEDETPII